jgi:parallel beta-helix repeat protein
MMARGRELPLLRRLAWAFVLLLWAGPVSGETVVLHADDWGTVNVPGSRRAHAVGGGGLLGEDVAFFVFDVPELADPIVAATIRLQNPPGTFQSPQGVERFVLYRGSEANTLASIEVTASSPDVLELPIEARFLRLLERSSGRLRLNGRLATLDKPTKPRERLFDGTEHPPAPFPQLVVTTDPMAAPAGPLTLHVDAASTAESPDGTSGAPFHRISDALSVATPGDDAEVAPGTYRESVALVEGVALRGSGPGQTTLDLSAFDGPGPIRCAEGARLEGFRILDPRPAEFVSEATISCAAVTSEIAHNVIEVGLRPAIVLTGGSQAWIHHNRIRGGPNAAWSMSMQTIMAWGDPIIEDNEIAATNAAMVLGGAGARVCRNVFRGFVEVHTDDLEPGEITVCDNLFLPSVESPRRGGLRREHWSDPTVTDPAPVRVLGNTFHDTPGIVAGSGETTIANNVIVNGTAGIQVDDDATAEIRNNDVFGNRAGVMGPLTNYVAIEDQTGLNGNISADPEFVDAFFEDFRLRPTSPARDAGSEAPEDVAGDEDLDGDPRVVDVLDMGAQEHQPSEELPLPPLPIAVDVLPGRSPNELKFAKVQKGSGKLAVAILSEDGFDAPADVNLGTLILERERALRCSDKDVDRDGRRDLLCSFPLRGISVESWPILVPPACVRGETHDGRKLLGCDEVEIPL